MKMGTVEALLSAFLILGAVGAKGDPKCELKYPLQCPAAVNWCPEEPDPVCASDGEDMITFANCCDLTSFMCIMNFPKEWHIVTMGSCQDRSRKCAIDCDPPYHPVCAANGLGVKIVFHNKCYLKAANCAIKSLGGKFQVVREGPCT